MAKAMRHSGNASTFKNLGEINEKPSMTVPNMSLSVNEILQRFANGQSMTKLANHEYHGDDYYPDPRTLDLVDIQNIAEENDAKIKELEKSLNEKRQAARREQWKQRNPEAYEAYKNQIKKDEAEEIKPVE